MIRSSLAAAAARSASASGTLLLSFSVARSLPATDGGEVFTALAAVAVASMGARFGGDAAILRHAGAAYVAHDFTRAHQHVAQAYESMRSRSVIATAVCLVLAFLAALADKLSLLPTLIMCAAIVPWTLAYLYAGVLKAAERTATGALLEPGLIGWITAPVFLGLSVAGREPTQIAVALIIATSSIALLVVVRVAASPLMAGAAVQHPEPDSEFNATSRSLGIVTIAQVLSLWSAAFILTAFVDPLDTAQYTIAVRIASVIVLYRAIFFVAQQPRMAKLFAGDEWVDYRSLVLRTTNFVAAVCVPAVLVLILFPSQILGVIGDEYRDASSVLIPIVLGQGVACLSAGSLSILSTGDGARVLASMSVVGFLVGLPLTIVGCLVAGADGAAIAAGIQTVGMAAAQLYYARQSVGFWPIAGAFSGRQSDPTRSS